jgi:molecular chaperone DnaK
MDANKNYAIGIDLGTSTSEICVYRNDEPLPIGDPNWRSPIVPSLIAINKKGELLVGEEARGLVDVSGQGIREIKRKMGTGETIKLLDREYRPEEVSALILRKLKENAEEALGITIQEVVLSVPANFPDAARQATLNAGELAGLKIIRLINEPTAAALAFGIKNIGVEEQLAIFDFGGGTLDITILEMVAGVLDVRCSFGNPQLGGKDFDEAMMNLLLQKLEAVNSGVEISDIAYRALKEVAEKTKKALSTDSFHRVRVPYFATCNGKSIDLDVEVTRAEFEMAIAPLLEQARECIRQALAARQLRPSAIDRILLVGGTTYIPAVRELVTEMFGKEPKADVNPDLAVGIGAAIQAALAQGLIDEESGVILTDVAPFGLGIDIVTRIGGQYILTYEPLIQPNTTIPYSTKKTYRLLHAEQEQVEIRLYQDNTGKAKLPSETIYTGISGEIVDIPPAADGNAYPIEVEFSYDINGIAKLKATISGTGKSIEITYDRSPQRMDIQDKFNATARIKDLWKQNARAKQYEAVINKAERFLAAIPPQEREPLSQIAIDLKVALATDNVEQIEKWGNILVDTMFEMGL